jgi:hypothetical protein
MLDDVDGVAPPLVGNLDQGHAASFFVERNTARHLLAPAHAEQICGKAPDGPNHLLIRI